MKKGKVLIALSGGEDSSIAAILLKEKAYDLVGVTLNVFSDRESRRAPLEKGIADAQTLAIKINIPYYVIDVTKDFDRQVIQYFVNEYCSGKTPNPCSKCNFQIKWAKLIELANDFGCDYIATGHYATVGKYNGRYFISEAEDPLKDQTSFLWRLSQEFLQKTLFPLGQLNKTEIKELAIHNGLKHIANKKESYNICFIPDGNYRDFLDRKLKPEIGNIVLKDGKIIGQHDGVWNFTIGQKKGINELDGDGLCVIEINGKNNELVVGEGKELLKEKILIKNVNYQKYAKINNSVMLKAKLRYRGELIDCEIESVSSNELSIKFKSPVSIIAPGQSIILFEGNNLVAGGVIA